MRIFPGHGIQVTGKAVSRTQRLRLPTERTAGDSGAAEATIFRALQGMDFRVEPSFPGQVLVRSLRVHYFIGSSPQELFVSSQSVTGMLPDTTYYLYVVADQTQTTEGHSSVSSLQVNIPKPSGSAYYFGITPSSSLPQRDTTLIINPAPPPTSEPLIVLKYTAPQISNAANAYYLIAEVDTDQDSVATVRQKHLGSLFVVGAPMLFNPSYVMTAGQD